MTEWEPATDAEAAMRQALRAGDQELYFRILSRIELLLPISAEALAGRAPLGWGTWTTGGRTHVLAFTSAAALRACLAEHAGSTRRVAYQELAATWPNLEWWMAVNPGLPIEGYLPAWFVAQLARGDVRLPGRATGAAAPTVPGQPIPEVAGDAEDGRPGDPAAADAAASAAPPRIASMTGTGSAPPSAPPHSDGRAATPVSAGGAAPFAAAAGGSAAGGSAASGAAPFAAAAGGSAADGSAAGGPASGSAPAGPRDQVAGPASTGTPPQGAGGPLPRRQVPNPSAPPRSMAEVARSMAAAGKAGHPQAYAAAAPPQPAPQPQRPVQPSPQRPAQPWPDQSVPPPHQASPPAQPWPDQSVPPQSTHPVARVADGPAGSPSGHPERSGGEHPGEPDFAPANEVEQGLLAAARDGSTEAFLSTLLLARVLVPVPDDADPHRQPGDEGFAWRTESIDGEHYVVVFTSPERLADHVGGSVHTVTTREHTVSARFLQLIRRWPDPSWSFAVNPGTPVGASLPGSQILALANWAVEVGLGDAENPQPGVPAPGGPTQSRPGPVAARADEEAARPTMMQKSVAPEHVRYYLDRGYDRVSGFVHRVNELEHLRTPAELHAALGLGYDGSPFRPDADEVFVLRWPAYRPTLYRIPYGGQSDAAMRAMEGWVIERPPFRGNGFAPGEGSDVIAEFKLDSTRLPHGAQLWRIAADGSQEHVAVFDNDALVWRKADEQ